MTATAFLATCVMMFMIWDSAIGATLLGTSTSKGEIGARDASISASSVHGVQLMGGVVRSGGNRDSGRDRDDDNEKDDDDNEESSGRGRRDENDDADRKDGNDEDDDDFEVSTTNAPCRMSNAQMNGGVNRCVEEPFPFDVSVLWCPYHPCVPSYVDADLCGADPLTRATHLCLKQTRKVIGYECKENGKHRDAEETAAACAGKHGCKDVRTCTCERVRRLRSTFTTERPVHMSDCRGEVGNRPSS